MRYSRCRGGPLFTLALLALLLSAPPAAWSAGDIMFDTKGVSDKPQSKLWYNDGFWWAALNNATKLSIYKLENNTWTAKLDLQNAVTPILKGGTCDALWDGTNLFVAVYDATTSKVYKLSYNSTTQTYALLSGFPISLSMRPGSETIVLDKDSLGRLWVTYEAEQKIYVMYSTSGDQKTWSTTPYAISTTNVDPDDISTVVAFGGSKIGVAWSDQMGQKLMFRSRRDTDPPTTWQSIETIRSGWGSIDDHLNMKADSQGKIFIAAKDYYDAVYVCRRNIDGTWTITAGASGLDCGTRPILQIDEADNKLYVFYTRWETCVSGGFHAIEERVSYLNNLLFSLPTVVISAPNVTMNEVQGTKQILPAGSLAILCEGNLKAYWTGWGSISNIGGSDPGGTFPPPPLPPADLAAQLVTESPVSCAALWRFDENSGTSASDGSGKGHNLSFASGLAAPHWTPGVSNSGLYFDGANYASTSGSSFAFIDTSFTLEAWIRADITNAPSTGAIFARGDSLHTNFMLSLTGQTLRFEWSYDDTTSVSIKASGPFLDGTWHHVAAVFEHPAEQARLYIDGLQVVTKTMLPPLVDGSWKLCVGALLSGSFADKTMLGWIDQACITQSAKYSGNFTPPLLFPASSTRYTRLTWSRSSSPAGITGYRVQRDVNGGTPVLLTASPTINAWYADLSPTDGWLHYWVRAVDGLTQQGPDAMVAMTYESNPPATPSAPPRLASSFATATVEGPAFWAMAEGGGSIAYDGTNLGHDAQLGGSATGDAAEPSWAYGFSDWALHFDGSDDYAQIADRSDLRFTGSFTIETWARRSKLNAQQALVTKDAGSSKRNYGILILSNGNIEFSWNKAGSSLRKTTSTTGITNMEWHHIACVYDAAQAKNFIWLDGVQVGTSDVTGTPYTGTEPILLGARGSGSGPTSDWLQGDMDLLRFTNSIRYSAPFTPPTYYGGGPRRRIVDLTWGLPGSGLVSQYKVYRQKLPSGTNTLIATVAYDAPWIMDTDVLSGSTYRYTVRATNSKNTEGTTSAPLDVTVTPPTDVLDGGVPSLLGGRLQVSPNPFNPQAMVSFRLEHAGPVEITLYDARGRKVETVFRGELQAGTQHLPLLPAGGPQHLASGVYFVRLRADGRDTRIKAVLVQ